MLVIRKWTGEGEFGAMEWPAQNLTELNVARDVVLFCFLPYT